MCDFMSNKNESVSGKVVVITGGNSGIGYATAALFAEQGANVFITGRRPDAVREAAKTLGHSVVGLVADAGDRAQMATAFAEVKRQYDHIDVLFEDHRRATA